MQKPSGFVLFCRRLHSVSWQLDGEPEGEQRGTSSRSAASCGVKEKQSGAAESPFVSSPFSWWRTCSPRSPPCSARAEKPTAPWAPPCRPPSSSCRPPAAASPSSRLSCRRWAPGSCSPEKTPTSAPAPKWVSLPQPKLLLLFYTFYMVTVKLQASSFSLSYDRLTIQNLTNFSVLHTFLLKIIRFSWTKKNRAKFPFWPASLAEWQLRSFGFFSEF